jgi:hypothetical protein
VSTPYKLARNFISLILERNKVMKLRKSIVILPFLLLAFQICVAQEKPKAVLVDEFGKVNYSNLRYSFDQFWTEIQKTPNSKGYIVIYGDKNEPLSKYYREVWLKEFISFRNFPASQLVFLYGEDKEELKTQFWIAPLGADRPTFAEDDWNYKLPKTIKPTVIHQTLELAEYGPEPLNLEFYIEFYSKFLNANPDSRGHLVIYDKSTKGFNEARQPLFEQLVKKNKVRQNQLKFFYVKSKKSGIEFWFVPKTTKSNSFQTRTY